MANAAAADATAVPPLNVRRICSEKYEAAKAAGTLNGEAWPQFYSRCTQETEANPPSAPVPTAPATPPAITPAPVNPLKKPEAKARGGGAKHRRLSHRRCAGLCQ
jgi:hypothetical protein